MYTTRTRRGPAGAHQLGLRRRLAPPIENDLDHIKLMNSLLLSMPGSPIVYYGDEIGMGDNFFIGDRNGCALPCNGARITINAGFSRADPQRLYLPPIMDAVYGCQSTNVGSVARSEFVAGNRPSACWPCARPARHSAAAPDGFSSRAIVKYSLTSGSSVEDTILCVANLSRSAQPVEPICRHSRAGCLWRCWAARSISAHRRAALFADHIGLWFLLVPAGHRRRSALMARAGGLHR